MIYGTVSCIGDSLVAGARAELGFPEHLPAILSSSGETEWAALNRGVSGETTRQILARTPPAIRELAGLPGARQIILLVGTNDSKGGGRISLDEFEALYRQVVHWPRRYEIPTVLCTLPPLRHRHMPAFTDRSVAWMAAASEIILEIGAELDGPGSPVTVCDLRAMPHGYLCGDGVHLKPVGYRWLAWRIAAHLGVLSDEPGIPAEQSHAPRSSRGVPHVEPVVIRRERRQ